MSIRNILVVYNGDEASNNALATAILLHKRHEAHLTALFIHGSSQSSTQLKPWTPQNIVDKVNEFEDEQYRQIENLFYDLTRNHVTRSKVHWISAWGEPSITLPQYARLYDLTVIGRAAQPAKDRIKTADPEQCALNSGAPVLVVPEHFKHRPEKDIAVIAWDGKRAAARALRASLKLLAFKQSVRILTIDNADEPQPLKQMDLETALERHQIRSQTVRLKRSGRDSFEKLLLGYCEKNQANILVIGAYEQNSFLGQSGSKLTSSIVKHSQVPVFLTF